jgi:hypothetical protein
MAAFTQRHPPGGYAGCAGGEIMTRKQSLRLRKLLYEATSDFGLIRTVTLDAPHLAQQNTEALERLFTQAECKLVAINCALIRGGEA